VVKITKSRVAEKVPEGSALILEITEFPHNRAEEASIPKTSSIRPSVSIEHRPVTEIQT